MDYEQVAEAVRRFPGFKEWGAGASPAEVAKAEEQLSLTLPDVYKRFLGEFGWLRIGSEEIHGLGGDVPSSIDLVRVTVSERLHFMPLRPRRMVPVRNDGGGNLSCLDASVPQRCPVLLRVHETGRFVPEGDDFTGWLSQLIRAECP